MKKGQIYYDFIANVMILTIGKSPYMPYMLGFKIAIIKNEEIAFVREAYLKSCCVKIGEL